MALMLSPCSKRERTQKFGADRELGLNPFFALCPWTGSSQATRSKYMR